MKYAILLLRVLLVLFFLMAGFGKITGSEQMVANFTNWGFPLSFMYFTGGFEIVLAFGLASRRLSRFSALLLGLTMIIATGIHLKNGENFMLTFILAILLWFVAKNHKTQQKPHSKDSKNN